MGCYFEAYLDGLTLERVQVEFVVIRPLVKFVKNRGSDPPHVLRSTLPKKKKKKKKDILQFFTTH